MTVSTDTNVAGPFNGNDSTTVFSFTFKIFEDADLVVTHVDSSGTETTLTLDSDYTVTGAGDPGGGSITYPISGSPLATGEQLFIERVLDETQEVDLRNQGAFFKEVLEDSLDKLTMLVQQGIAIARRSFKVPISDNLTSSQLTLAGKTQRANTLFGFDQNGIPELIGIPASLSGDFEIIANMTSLKSFSPTNKAVVLMKGFHSSYDGGGGFFEWDSASEDADDGGTIIQLTGGGTGRWKRINNTSYVLDKWFGAKVDGSTDDGAYQQLGMDAAVAQGKDYLVSAGESIIENRGLLPTGYIRIIAQGSKSSVWRFKGTFARTVQTEIAHPNDGPDPAINIAVKLIEAYSEIRGLRVECDFDSGDPNDYGADIDCGVFVDAVPFCKLVDVRCTGYWRQAGCYADITKDSVSATLDFLHIEDCWFQGFWGLRIQGPEPETGQTDLDVSDNRGRGGASDVYLVNNRLWGMNHHSKVRFSDTDGGAYKKSGKIYGATAGPSRVHRGSHHIATRFQTPEPYAFYVDACHGEFFGEGCKIDRPTGWVKTDTVTGVTDADHEFVLTDRTINAYFDQMSVFRATENFDADATWQGGAYYTLTGAVTKYVHRGDVHIQSNIPTFILNEQDQGADAKKWKVSASGGLLVIQTLKDDDSFGANALIITRSGSAISSVNINGPCILNSSNVTVPNLPTSNPGGTRRLWVDTGASNVVKAT